MDKINKIILAQLNPISADVEYNKNKTISAIKEAIKKKAKLIIFPELFLIGYPMGDVLGRYPYLADQCKNALNEIAEVSDNIAVLIGFPEKNTDKFGKPYYNSVALIRNKKIEKIFRKTLLPNYAEHNDYRYFEPAQITAQDRIFELDGIKYGVVICEDGWNDYEFFDKNLYKIDPMSIVAPKVDVILCPAASCSRAKKEQLKHNMMSYTSKKYAIKYIYVNQVGANDELVYDGTSRMYNEEGNLCAMAHSFEEELFELDLYGKNKINPLIKGLELTLNSQKEFSLDHKPDIERTYIAIKTAICDYFSKNGFKRAVLGLSGGLDSTICAVLLADALGSENVFGISMPSDFTTSQSKTDAQELAENLGINFMTIPIKDSVELLKEKYSNIFSNVEKSWDNRYKKSFTIDNIQARARSMILWGIANEFAQTLPIATSDKSELYMGYATINGDMSGGYAPIADVVKTKLFALARWMNENRSTKNAIPESIILKPPTAELAINDETGEILLAEEALMPYEFLDEVIWRIENLNQSKEDMMNADFLYEKKNNVDISTKKGWLDKFFKRLNSALYKWYIVPPSPVIDARSINKIEFKQPIVSNIDYFK